MELTFIDNNAPLGGQSRKRIRSHVMKGKNLGRTIPDRGWKKRHVRHQAFDPNDHAKSDDDLGDINSIRDVVQTLPFIYSVEEVYSLQNPFAGNEFTFFKFPMKLTAPMRYMIYHFHSSVVREIYPHHFCRLPGPEVTSTPWFKSMITDEACFHALFVVAATYLSLFHGQSGSIADLELPRHFVHSLHLVNQELATLTTLKSSTIVVIVTLTVRASLTGAVDESRIHLEGLQRMIGLSPGGLAALRKENPILVQKICRADIEIALREGTPTRFGSEPEMRRTSSLTSSSLGTTGTTYRIPDPSLSETSTSLKYIARDVLALCRCAYDGWRKLEPCQYQDVIISILHRLIEFRPLQETRKLHPADDAWQVGLLGFMTTILHAKNYQRALYSDILVAKLRTRLSEEQFVKDRRYHRLQLWLLFVYNFLVPEACDGRWLVPLLQTVIGELKLTTWKQGKKRLSGFPWIDLLHDELSEKLWNSAMPSEETGEYVKYLAVGI